MRSLRKFLLTSAVTLAPSFASATTIEGLYVDGGAGYDEVQDQHVHANGSAGGPAVQKFTVNHGTGFTGFGSVGWGFGNGLRVEAEGVYSFSHDSYTNYNPENRTSTSTTTTQQQGTQQTILNPFYTPVKNVGLVPCSQMFPGAGGLAGMLKPYWNDVKSSWGNVPMDRCYLFQGANAKQEWSDLNNSPMGVSNTPYGYNGTNPEPGVYSYREGITSLKPQQATGIPVFPNEPQFKTFTPTVPVTQTHQQVYQVMTAANHQGSDQSYGGFANVLYDFDLERLAGIRSIATPFFWGGRRWLSLATL
ncbi:MAG: hypothetical protein IJ934_01100 [Acetobacter sp.]|nr:hypothetical protein [Acetobacter sp.]